MQHQRDLMSFDIRTTSRSTYRSDTIGTWRSLSCWHLNCIMGNIQSYWLYHSPPPTIFRRTPCIILKTVCSLFVFDRYSVNWFTSQISSCFQIYPRYTYVLIPSDFGLLFFLHIIPIQIWFCLAKASRKPRNVSCFYYMHPLARYFSVCSANRVASSRNWQSRPAFYPLHLLLESSDYLDGGALRKIIHSLKLRSNYRQQMQAHLTTG